MQSREGEQGFMLLGLIVAIAIILLMLGVAAPRVAFELRREREMESARRADQYVRAIRKFYLKNKSYPASIKQLDNTNMVRYLRQEYVDPLTGKADYRLIGVGKNKTTVTSFFGAPLAGLPTAGLGSAAGMQSAGVGGAGGPGGAAGAAGASGAASGFGVGGGSGFGAGAAGSGGTTGATGSTGAGGGATGANGANGATDNSGTPGSSTNGLGGPTGLGSAAGMQSAGMPGSGGSVGPFMGVGSSANGTSIFDPNGQTQYEDWEFLYDPRVELLKAKAGMNAGLGSVGAGALGQTPGTNPAGTPGANNPFGNPTNSTGPGGANGPGTANPTQP